ncbi:AI-2E family transporter [Actinocatenispora sera]|uniref:AI-2E family transporter n=1 Tax=Actinocatenispora sera TaxID=390989 RepID=A0A810KUE1_9ACTN|nr:AI-2E family transporter [Actinocatenispora sera]BCJ26644.1 AI-2E family transporter [Actinocatenispora sera]
MKDRARGAWQAARGRLEEGRERSDQALLQTATATTPPTPPPDAPAAPAAAASAPEPRPAELSVPRGVRVAAAWSWRMIVIVAAVIGAFTLLTYVSNVMIPAIIALLLTALLQPGATWLRRHGVPRSLASLIMVVLGIVVVAGVLTGVVTSFINGFSDLSDNVAQGIQKIQQWLHSSPLHISDKQINGALKEAQKWLSRNRGAVTSGALSTATTVGEVLVDLFLILFTTFFLVRDGRPIWNFILQLGLPRSARAAVDDAGSASWRSLVAYVRATVLVAFIDAFCIGIGIVAVGVPYSLAIPLAALIFLGAFIPIVGATVSGVVAVLVTLVTNGLIAAIIVLAVVLGVQQLEGHILQPLIMGRAVAVHPLGVILGITGGIAIGGIFGGLIAVPFIAVMNTAIRHLVARQRHRADPPTEEAEAALPSPQQGEPEPG